MDPQQPPQSSQLPNPQNPIPMAEAPQVSYAQPTIYSSPAYLYNPQGNAFAPQGYNPQYYARNQQEVYAVAPQANYHPIEAQQRTSWWNTYRRIRIMICLGILFFLILAVIISTIVNIA